MGLAGARACEGGWLSGPVIHEHSRGHPEVLQVGGARADGCPGQSFMRAPADTRPRAIIHEDFRCRKIACRRGESNTDTDRIGQ
jgi:hypothetical protein